MSGAAPGICRGPIDLAGTLGSGQVFHWDALNDGSFVGTIGDAPVILRAVEKGDVEVTGITAEKASRYLGLEDDLEAIRSTFPQDDESLNRAIAYCPDLRILRQPAWECLATFITSSLKQVPQIREISLRLRREFGAAHEIGGHQVHSYPTPEAIAEAGEDALRKCRLGYRARSLFESAQLVASGDLDLEAIRNLEDPVLEAELMRCRGVGEKVARCVTLFAYSRPQAFPVDTWVIKALHTLYFPRRRRDRSLKELHQFALRHFGPHAGHAQQYLFHWARTSPDSFARK